MAIATPNNIEGYDYNFVDTPHDRYICRKCGLPSRDPYLSKCCGHVFCKFCLDDVKKVFANNNACPICRDEEFVTFPNKQSDREIRKLHIYCTNKEKGCKWQGKLNDINNHLGNSDGCQFERVKCSNECGKMIERQHLISHVKTKCPRRKVNCHYCHHTVEYQFIECQHKKECPRLPLPCPNRCKVGNVHREDMEAHRKECPLEIIQCEYHNVGCEVRMARKNQEKHENDETKEHLKKTNKQLQRVEILLHLATNIAISRPTSTAVVLESSVEWPDKLVAMVTMAKVGNQMCPAILKISQFNKEKMSNKYWYSDSFYTHNKGYKMCLCVDAACYGDGKGTHLSMFLFLMKGPHDDELTWPLRGKFEIKLLNQISDSEHYSVMLTFDHTTSGADKRVKMGDRAANGLGKPKFISNEDLHKTTPKCLYLKDDCLFFQVTKL